MELSKMRHAFLAALLAPLALGALPAVAADLPYRQAPADYYAPVPVTRWQGFYAGLNAGYGWGSFTDDANWLFAQPSGGEFGFTGGYNYMVAPNFLIGAEADFDFTGISATNYPYPGRMTSGNLNDLFTLRGRVGYTMDRALFFISGGLAGGRTEINMQNVWWGNFWGQQSSYQLGWALGAGVEYLVIPNISVKAEYLFTSLGSTSYFNYSPWALQVGSNNSQVRLGVNYHF
ncbi:membrane protein [Methylocystis bryophila]|nr:membrane protein [Methylocystis bryophila]